MRTSNLHSRTISASSYNSITILEKSLLNTEVAYIYIVDEDRKKVSKQIDHCLVAAKPFKNIDPNKPVRFTGKITSYMRSNGSYDYSIIVNKAREASKEELKCYISH